MVLEPGAAAWTRIEYPDGGVAEFAETTLGGDRLVVRRTRLVGTQAILQGIDGIRFCYFSERDVVRHRLVRDIISAYDRVESAAKPADTSKEPA